MSLRPTGQRPIGQRSVISEVRRVLLRRTISSWNDKTMHHLKSGQHLLWRSSTTAAYARFQVSKDYGGSAYDLETIDEYGQRTGHTFCRVALTEEAEYGKACQLETEKIF